MSVPHCMLSNAWSIPPLPAPVTRPIPRSRDEAGTTTTTGAVAAVEAKAAQPGVDAVLIENAGVLLLLLLLVVRDVDVDVAQTTHPRIDAVREGRLRRLRCRLGRALCGTLCAHRGTDRRLRRVTTVG